MQIKSNFFLPFIKQTAEIFIFTFHDIFRSKGRNRYIVERNSRAGIQHFEILECFLSYFDQILGGIFVFDWFHLKVQFTVGLVCLIEPIGFGDIALYILANCYSSLVGPQPSHIVDGITSSSQQHQRNIVSHHLPHTLSMPLDTQIQPSKHIIGD